MQTNTRTDIEETLVAIPERFSPSGIGTYLDCQERYRCERVAKLPTRTNADQARGLAVHTVFERLMALDVGERNQATALGLAEVVWAEMLGDPTYALVVATDGYGLPTDVDWPERAAAGDEPIVIEHGIELDQRRCNEMLESIRGRVRMYFRLGARPDKVGVVALEPHVEAALGKYRVHGFIDRLDAVAGVPNGVRIVDYKSGKAPLPRYAADKFAQLRLYAYAVAQSTEWVPTQLMLVFLNPERPGVLTETVTAESLVATEGALESNIGEIVASYETDTWEANPSILCNWCDFRYPIGDLYPGCSAYADAVAQGRIRVL